MPNYPYSFQLPPLNVQDIPNNGAVGEFLGISAGGVLDWLPVSASGSGDLLAANNLSELTPTASTARTNLGLGTGDSPTFKNLVISTGSITTSAPVTISQTWADVAQTFKALVVNAAGTSDANSASGSLLADFQVNGVSKFKVDKAGVVTAGSSFNLPNGPVIREAAGGAGGQRAIVFYNGGDLPFGVNQGVVSIRNDYPLIWASSVDSDTPTPTLALQQDGAANTLALRNSTAAQTFRVYKTYSNAGVDFERFSIDTTGATILLAYESGGTGTNKNVVLRTNADVYYDCSNHRFRNSVTGGSQDRMIITSAGNVGIGTTAPASGLHVAGALGSNTTTYDSAAALKLSNTTDGSSWLLTAGIIGVLNGSFSIRPGAASLPSLVISNTGNVGIGTTAPSSKLDVVGNAVFSGNVGVGVTTPGNKFHIAESWNSSATGFTSMRIVVTDNASAAGSGFLGLYSGSSTQPLKLDVEKTGQLNIYGTWTNSTTYERLSFSAPTSANAVIGTNKAGTGTARGLEIQTDGVTRMTIPATGAITFSSQLGTFSAVGNSTFANIFLADSSVYGYANNFGTGIRFASDGVGQLRDNAGTSFGLLQFGGTTASFPALKRSSTTLQAVLANDSGFTNIQGKLTTDTAYTGTTVVPTGFITLYDSTGTAYKVPCVAA